MDQSRAWKIEFEIFFGDDAGAVEGVIEPEIGGEWMMSCGSDDAVFEEVAGLEAEDANGFDADVMIGGILDYSGIGVVSDGAGENIGGSSAFVRDADHGDFYRLKAAVEIEVQPAELVRA